MRLQRQCLAESGINATYAAHGVVNHLTILSRTPGAGGKSGGGILGPRSAKNAPQRGL